MCIRDSLRTEASSRFEKGIDINLAEEAVNRACQLIEELGCGTVLNGMLDYYPQKEEVQKVTAVSYTHLQVY